MVRAARLKVYRTPIGFHDAYVAAPSQKAALKAWGSAHDLFSTGEAELVTDAALTEAPLAEPGVIVRRVRGTTAEHIAALPAEPEAPPEPEARPAPPEPRKPRPPPKPRLPKPDQTAVVTAKAELKAALDEQARERRALKQREEALRREREALEARQATAAASLREAVEAAETAYRDALQKWQESRR